MRIVTLLGVVSMGTALATGGFLGAGIGCGGNAVSNADGGGGLTGGGGSTGKGGGGSKGTAGSGTGGTKGSGGSKGSGGAKGSGGTAGSPTDGGMGFETSTCSGGIACCPDTPCPSGDKCCANITAVDAAAAFTCTTDCSPTDTLGCTAASDCTGAEACCITATFMGGTGGFPGCLKTGIQSVNSTCTSTCAQNVSFSCTATDTLKLCESSSDCTDSKLPLCCEVPLGGRTYAACLPSLAKLGGLTCM